MAASKKKKSAATKKRVLKIPKRTAKKINARKVNPFFAAPPSPGVKRVRRKATVGRKALAKKNPKRAGVRPGVVRKGRSGTMRAKERGSSTL